MILEAGKEVECLVLREGKRLIVRLTPPKSEKKEDTSIEVAPADSRYSLGIMIGAVDPLLRRHLPFKHGILIIKVAKASPAEKAGLLVDDILLSVNQKPVTDPDMVTKFIREQGRKKLHLKILRAGKTTNVIVMPEPLSSFLFMEERTSSDHPEAFKNITAAQKDRIDHLNLDLRYIHPGILVGNPNPVQLPKGLEVTIKHTGGEKSPILTIKKGDEVWETTPDTLLKKGSFVKTESLVPVLSYLGFHNYLPSSKQIRGPIQGKVPYRINFPQPAFTNLGQPGSVRTGRFESNRLDRWDFNRPAISSQRLEKIERQLEAIQKQLRELSEKK